MGPSVASAFSMMSGNLRNRTKLCKHFTKGYCKFQDNCLFAHDFSELVYRPDLTKTKLCRRFMEGGCFNDACSFAHGIADLREVDYVGPRGRVEAVGTPGSPGTIPIPFANRASEISDAEASWSDILEPVPAVPAVPAKRMEMGSKTRRNANKIPVQPPEEEGRLEEHGSNHFSSLPSQRFDAVVARWLLLAQHLQWQRRLRRLHHGRVLLDTSRLHAAPVSPAELELVLSIFAEEPEWCADFDGLACLCSTHL